MLKTSKQLPIDDQVYFTDQKTLVMALAAQCHQMLTSPEHENNIADCLNYFHLAVKENSEINRAIAEFIPHQKSFVELLRKCSNSLQQLGFPHKIDISKILLEEYKKILPYLIDIEIKRACLTRRGLVSSYQIISNYLFKKNTPVALKAAQTYIENALNELNDITILSVEEDKVIHSSLIKEYALTKLTIIANADFSPDVLDKINDAIAYNNIEPVFSSDYQFAQLEKIRFYENQRQFAETLTLCAEKISQDIYYLEFTLSLYLLATRIMESIPQKFESTLDFINLFTYRNKLITAIANYYPYIPEERIADNAKAIDFLQIGCAQINKLAPVLLDDDTVQRGVFEMEIYDRQEKNFQLQQSSAKHTVFFKNPANQQPLPKGNPVSNEHQLDKETKSFTPQVIF